MFDNFDTNNENIVKGGKPSLICGPMMFRPVYINPTRKQLNEFLDSDKKTEEINYHFQSTVQEEQVDTVRISMWGYFTDKSGQEFKGCLDPIWLKNKPMVSKDKEKNCWINPYGRVAWAKTAKQVEYDWYNLSARHAIWGEDCLMDFFINLMGINTYYSKNMDEATIPAFIKNEETYINVSKIFMKDYSELQGIINRFCTDKTDLKPENPNYMRKVTVLSSVTNRVDNGDAVQCHFTGKFGRVRRKGDDYSIVDSDVNQILKAARNLESKGLFKHVGILTNVPTLYEPGVTVDSAVPESW